MILLLRVAQQEGWAAQSALVPILIRPDHSENLFQDHLRPFLLLFLGQESITKMTMAASTCLRIQKKCYSVHLS